MTTTTNDIRTAIDAANARRREETARFKAIEDSLPPIRARRDIRRTHRHSVRHRAIR